MPAIVWNDSFSVKIDRIDQQHRRLVALVNDLDTAMRAGKGKEILAKTLGALIDYTKTHFVTEEALLQTQGYPELAIHKAEHDQFTQKVIQLQQQFEKSKLGLSIPVMNFLSAWLKTHILGSDKQYSGFLHGKGVS